MEATLNVTNARQTCYEAGEGIGVGHFPGDLPTSTRKDERGSNFCSAENHLRKTASR